jgi:STAS domain
MGPEQAIVLDLSGVEFMDSACVKVLVQARGKLTQDGGSLIPRNPSPVAHRLLTITVATAAQDVATFAFGCAAPDTVVDAVGQRVFETHDADWAVCASPLGVFDAQTAGWEKLRLAEAATACVGHPRVRFGGLGRVHAAPK